MAKILIKNGKVVDPDSGLEAKRDLLIENGKIVAIKSKLKPKNCQVIEAKGLLVLPGLIDMHTHLRDPGEPEKETIASGCRAAAKGGFTTICCMANTRPVVDTPAIVEYIRTRAEKEGLVNVLPVGAVTKGLAGKELSEFALMIKEGAVAFSDDGQPIVEAGMMRRALEYAKQFKTTIISHCEDHSLAHNGSINESALSTQIGLPAIPALAEEVMVARDLSLAKQFGHLHLAHISSAGSVELIRQAKKKKVAVTAETCPHYFSLTQEAVLNYDTNAKVNPPLKTKNDLKAIIKALKEDVVDVIATDHAPHNLEAKKTEFDRAAFGLVGLETALGLVLTKLVKTKDLALIKAVAKLTINPAKILGLEKKGRLQIGCDADLIIVDPEKNWQVRPEEFASLSRNTPFAGWQLQGQVLYTIVSGKVVVKNGKIVS